MPDGVAATANPHWSPTPQTLAAQGYCLLPQVLETRDVVAMRAAINETIDRVAMALRTPFPASRPGVPLDERLEQIAAADRMYGQALFRAILADAHNDARITALASHRCLREALEPLLCPLARNGETVRLRGVVPTLSSAASSWRQEVVRLDNRRADFRFACWVPLRDVDESTGALEVAAGRWYEPLPHIRDEQGHLRLAEPPSGERRVVAMRRGDVLVLDRFLPHRALPVTRGTSRWTVVVGVEASPTIGLSDDRRAGVEAVTVS